MTLFPYVLFGLSATAMCAVLAKAVATLNRLQQEKTGDFLGRITGLWWPMFIVSPIAFFSTSAALIHLMPEKVYTFLVYAFFGLGASLMLLAVIGIVSTLRDRHLGLKAVSVLGWTTFVGIQLTFFTSLAALIHLVSTS